MKLNRLFASVLAVLFIFAGPVASAQQGVDRFTSEAACVAVVKAGTAVWYQPSFFDHRNRPPSRPVAVTRPLEERACAEMWIVGGWHFVPQPGVPQAGDRAPKFDFDGSGQPIRRSDCGNRVRKIVYVPVPPPPPPPPPQPTPPPLPPPPPRVDVTVTVPVTVSPPPPTVIIREPRQEPRRVERPRRRWPWVALGLAAGGAAAYFATRGGGGSPCPAGQQAGPKGCGVQPNLR